DAGEEVRALAGPELAQRQPEAACRLSPEGEAGVHVVEGNEGFGAGDGDQGLRLGPQRDVDLIELAGEEVRPPEHETLRGRQAWALGALEDNRVLERGRQRISRRNRPAADRKGEGTRWRSEERRVGNEGRDRVWRAREKE